MYQKRLFGRAFLCIFCMGSSLVAPIVQAAPLAADAGHTEIQHTDIVDPDAALSLHDVVEKAYARNPTQPILAARMAEVRARRTVATSLLPHAPAVGMSAQNDAVGSGRGERDWQAELELPVWLQGQRNARKNVADAADEDLAASRDSLKLQVAGYVREAIWDIRMNANALELADLRLNTAMALEHDVQRRFEAGELAKTDLMLAQNERIIAETGRLRAEAELMHARHRYIILTGLHTMPQQLDEAQSAQEDYSEQHPYYREAMSRLGLTQQARELARLERRENPQVILNARSQRGPFENAFNDSIGLKLRIPLDSPVRAAPIEAAAEMEVGRAQSARDSLIYQLETAMHEAEHNLTVSRAELEMVTRQQALAQENLRLANKAFQLGETDLVGLMRIQALAYEAERALTTRRIQLQWDIARYNQAVGVLP